MAGVEGGLNDSSSVDLRRPCTCMICSACLLCVLHVIGSETDPSEAWSPQPPAEERGKEEHYP